MRGLYKKSFTIILLVLSFFVCTGFKCIHEDSYDKNDSGSFDVYFKNKDGNYKFYKTLYYDKNVSTKKFNIDKKIYGIKLVKKSGYEVNIDELTLNNKTDVEYQRKLNETDNDLIEVKDSSEFNIIGSGTLVISARCPKKLKGTEYAFQFPANSSKDYVNYTLDKNIETVSDDDLVIPSRENIIYEKYNAKPDSGHPEGPISYYVSNDNDYLYVFTEAFIDNTYDHGKDYSKVLVNDGEKTKKYQVNTVEENEYGKWWFEYTDNIFDIEYQHMLYLVKIPVSDFNSNKLKLSFEYYGTSAYYDAKHKISFSNKDENDEYIETGKFKLYGDFTDISYPADTLFLNFYNEDTEEYNIYCELSAIHVDSGNNVVLESNFTYLDFLEPVNDYNDILEDMNFKLKQLNTLSGYVLNNEEYNVILQVTDITYDEDSEKEIVNMEVKTKDGENINDFKFINYREHNDEEDNTNDNTENNDVDEVVSVADTKKSLPILFTSIGIIFVMFGTLIVLFNSKYAKDK